jgi:hypothetical protein
MTDEEVAYLKLKYQLNAQRATKTLTEIPRPSSALTAACPIISIPSAPSPVGRSRPVSAVIERAGEAAWNWWIDTGECLFCCVDNAQPAQHEEFCPFADVGLQ